MRVGAAELHASGGQALDHRRESTSVAGVTPRGRRCREGFNAGKGHAEHPSQMGALRSLSPIGVRGLGRSRKGAFAAPWATRWPDMESVSKGRLQPDGQGSASLRFLRQMHAILAFLQRNRTRGWRHRVCTVRIEYKRPSKRSPSHVDQRLAAFASCLPDLSHRFAVGWRAGPNGCSQGLHDRLGLRHRVSVRLWAGQ